MFQNPHQQTPGNDASTWLNHYAQANNHVLQRYLSEFGFLNSSPPVGYPSDINYVHQIYRTNPFLIPSQFLQAPQVLNWCKMMVSNYQQSNQGSLTNYVSSGQINNPGPIHTNDTNMQLLHCILNHNPTLKNDLVSHLMSGSTNMNSGYHNQQFPGMHNQPNMPMQHHMGNQQYNNPSPGLTPAPSFNVPNNPHQQSSIIGGGVTGSRYYTPEPPVPEIPNPPKEERQVVQEQPQTKSPRSRGGIVTAEQIDSMVGQGVSKTYASQDDVIEPSDYILLDHIYTYEHLTSAVINSSKVRISEGDTTLISQIAVIENPYFGVDHQESLTNLFSKKPVKMCEAMQKVLKSTKLPMSMVLYRDIEERLTDLVIDRLTVNHSGWTISAGFFSDFKSLVEGMKEDEDEKEKEILGDIEYYLNKVFTLFNTWTDEDKGKEKGKPLVHRTCSPEVAIISAINKTKSEICYDRIPSDGYMLLHSVPMFKFLYKICDLLRDNMNGSTGDMDCEIFLKLATRFYITTTDYGCIELAFDKDANDFYLRRAV